MTKIAFWDLFIPSKRKKKQREDAIRKKTEIIVKTLKPGDQNNA